MVASFAKKYSALLSWRPNLIGQFLFSTLLSLLPLSLVVIVFLNALNKQLAVTQQIVSENYQITKSFNNLKQDLNSLERATRQNWVLKSESLDELIVDKWQSSLQSIDELTFISSTGEYIKQWQQLAQVLQLAHTQLVTEGQQDAQLFIPVSELIARQTVWLRDQNELQITKNQQQLKALQSSFINWLIALIPLTLLVGGGFLWRISGRLKGLTSVIDKLGQGHWQQKIAVQGSAELVELGNKLQWVQEQLHQLEQQKDTFLRHVTHELKTPLASMVEGTDLLADEIVGPINKEQQAVLALITQSMVRLRAMIDSLLSYNAIRSSKEDLSELEFSQLITKINSHFEHRLVARKQSLCWHCELPEQPLEIAAELVEMILIQLISNGLKFSPAGQAVNIALSLAGRTLTMSVSDQGTGIKEQEKSHIFSAFYQGKNAKDVTAQGSGLGLTIVKESVEQLMGTLHVEHNEPQGCRFIIQIPIIPQTNKNQGVN
ncbi:HAMP domain-containing sensor histidine kinase [Pseudoalteromonas sp. SG44-17]|uniref:sensor histidine kinase n=1 Tax=Pseudoalteromonas sp. SG44-17 TaxID=2760963 RepID=UPI001603383F|nr:HAMP domain-containing sensor histidine kinase [Pseudoalteromonas sp. SG44-17]MBB1408692.1 HAMP domain-containing histidine kinase [Pseudoalteromonas sp. SG44-17]